MVIHQTLHGYAEGHRLLGSSVPLSPEAEHLMAILSDISGPSAGLDFESYLTGYPVGDGWYAFARTWLAREMHRPGCVWTHTLLIDGNDLALLRDARALVSCFRRPRGDDLREYSTPIQADPHVFASDGAFQLHVSSAMAGRILGALYGRPTARAVQLITEKWFRHEELVLALWMQQWPALRRSFTFCTFALEDRTLRGAPFDLQIIPRGALSWRDQVKGEGIIDLDVEDDGCAEESWIHAAIDDLFGGERNRGALRQFLWEFGNDVGGGRAAFQPLVEVHEQLRGWENLAREETGEWSPASNRETLIGHLVSVVAAKFPTAREAANLKQALLGAPESRRWRLDEAEVLFELARTPNHEAFDADALALGRRAMKLWASDPKDARQLMLKLLEVEVSPLGEGFLGELCYSADSWSLAQIAETRCDLVGGLIRKNPRLAIRSELWSGPDDRQRELWDALKDTEAWSSLTLNVEAIVRAMLDAGANAVATDAVSQFGIEAIEAVLNWAGSVSRQLSTSWRRALAEHPSHLVKWLQTNEFASLDLVSLVSSLLGPDSVVVRQVDLEFWIKLAKRMENEEHPPMGLMAFLLCIGLETPGDQAAELVTRTFEPIHDAAGHNTLGSGEWSVLERRLPWIWREWDRCERLRRGLVDRFLKNGWSPGYLLRAVKGDQTFELIVGYCYRDAPGGKRLIESLVREMNRGAVSATVCQKTILARYGQRLGY